MVGKHLSWYSHGTLAALCAYERTLDPTQVDFILKPKQVPALGLFRGLVLNFVLVIATRNSGPGMHR